MNTTTRKSTLRAMIVALPLAAAALTLTPGTAMADTEGPVIVLPQPQPPVDPQGPGETANPETEPEPHPQPADPQIPGDKDGPKDDDGPQIPGDKDGPGDGGFDHDGPGEITNPTCPTHGGGEDCVPDTDGGNGGEPTEQPEQPKKKARPQAGDQPRDEVTAIALPTRVDAGLAPAAPAEGGLELTWLLAGGALVTASGAAFATRRVRRQS